MVETDWTHSVLASQYGTQMDDANAGKWVKYAIEKHGTEVQWVANREVVYEVAQGCEDTSYVACSRPSPLFCVLGAGLMRRFLVWCGC